MIKSNSRRSRRPSASQLRSQSQARAGLAFIALTVLGFVSIIYACVALDAARGMTVVESFQSAGL
jgi:hypothetical protein